MARSIVERIQRYEGHDVQDADAGMNAGVRAQVEMLDRRPGDPAGGLLDPGASQRQYGPVVVDVAVQVEESVTGRRGHGVRAQGCRGPR